MYKGFSSDPHSAYIGEKKKNQRISHRRGKLELFNVWFLEQHCIKPDNTTDTVSLKYPL